MLMFKELRINESIDFIYLISKHAKLQIYPEFMLTNNSKFEKLLKTHNQNALIENLKSWILDKMIHNGSVNLREQTEMTISQLIKLCSIDMFTPIKLLY